MIKRIFKIDDCLDFINCFKNDNIFSDPHFTYNPDNLFNAINRKDEIILATYYNDTITGLYVLLVIPEDHYTEIIIALSKEDESYNELLNYLKNSYQDYLIDFVVNPNNYILLDKLKKLNSFFDNEQVKLIHTVSNKDLKIDNDIILYDAKYKEQYLNIHSKDVYWTGEKILKSFDKFRVFLAIDNEKVIGYLDITHCFEENEPYDLFVKEGYEDKVQADLLIKAIEMNQNKKIMVLLDVIDIDAINLFLSVGFTIVDNQNSIAVHWKNN